MKIDTEPLELWEYQAIQAQLPPHWQLFYWLLWETGLRVSEALGIQKADLKDAGIMATRLKKKKPQVDLIPLPSTLLQALYLQVQAVRGKRLFPYTRGGAWLALKRASELAGVRRSMHPHLYRHGFGHRGSKLNLGLTALEHEALLQRLMGHSSPVSTRVYFKPTEAEVQQAWRKFHKRK